jgi:lysophospholipase L1-like esterase
VRRLASFVALLAAVALTAWNAAAPAEAAPKLGVATPIEDPGHRGLGKWYAALRAASEGKGVARALHYGDSTIAADGLASTVRGRLVARFGDAGPGFVSGAFDPRHNERADIESRKSGDWDYKTILFGGAGGRYGLGGLVGILRAGASVKLSAVRAPKTASAQRRLEVWYQAGQGYGALWVKADDREVARESAVAAATEDRWVAMDVPGGFTSLAFGATGGPVPVYGIVLETGAPGATWESVGVIGAGSRSFTTFAGEHLAAQMAVRKPDLVVVMLGGNEAGYPVLLGNKGAGYVPIYDAALKTILAGANGASCLVITPLDQGFVDEETGEAKARPGMKHLVQRQREVAAANGCAFWSAWAAMGGEGASLTWAGHGAYGTGDYVHLTGRGLAVIGNLLADAILADYDAWARSP